MGSSVAVSGISHCSGGVYEATKALVVLRLGKLVLGVGTRKHQWRKKVSSNISRKFSKGGLVSRRIR